VLAPVGAFGAITYDGKSIPTDFLGMLKATQVNATSFGDTLGVGTGSELDQLYVARSATGIYIGITGNLEKNGNAFTIFMETGSGGVTTVPTFSSGPGAVTNLKGSQFDAGFAPNYALTVNHNGTTMWADFVNLTTTGSTYLGSCTVNSGKGDLAGGDGVTQIAFNNFNVAGITDNQTKTAAETQADAATAATGFEAFLPFSDFGIVDPSSLTSIKIMVLLDAGSGWVSNQSLPGFGGQKPAPGQPPCNFADDSKAPGNQYATVDISRPITGSITVDGAAIPTDFAGHLVATQDNYTGWGDKTGEAGSEMDQLFVGQDGTGLQVGITGNLQPTGDMYLLFLQTGPGGSQTLTVPDNVGPNGVLQGMRDTKFDNGFQPNYVLCINAYQGLAYVDLVDLKSGTGRYLGSSNIGGGAGTLNGGDSATGIIVAMDNSNIGGVTETSAANAATATAGTEIYLPYSEIGLASSSVKVMAVLVGSSGYISNQVLPPIPAGSDNLGPGAGNPAVDFSGINGDQFVSIPVSGISYMPLGSVKDAIALPQSSAVMLQSLKVSASFPNDGAYYVQDTTGPFGLLVIDSANQPAEGSCVTVSGFTTTVNNQRALNATQTTVVTPPDSIHIKPAGMGSAVVGKNNTDALVRIWGKVTGWDLGNEAIFYVDDGKGIYDGNVFGYTGIRVLYDFEYYPNVGDCLGVTGISSFKALTDPTTHITTYIPQVRARTLDDISFFPNVY